MAVEIATGKELRWNVIETLYAIYPQEVAVSTLRSLLRYKGANTEADIKKAVYYLNGKEYIQLKEAEDYGDTLMVLTPVGINLAERDVTDVGVMMNE
ncbi:MAG: hypothetical protein ACRCW1_06185 [Anaerotignaceae bacterium]